MIELDSSQMERAARMLAHIPEGAPKAVSRALNRASVTAKNEMARKAREKYYVKQRDLTTTIKINKAAPDSLTAEVKSEGKAIALSKFKINPSRPQPGRRAPIAARVKRGGGGAIGSGFVARMRSGHIGVFTRAGRRRLPIKERYGPSVPQMLGNEEVMEHAGNKASEMFEKRLDHEIDHILEVGR